MAARYRFEPSRSRPNFYPADLSLRIAIGRCWRKNYKTFIFDHIRTISRSGAMPIWFGRRAWGPWGLWLSGARTEVEPMPALPDGPLIFASNHESALDIWVAFKVLPRAFRFIAKAELFRLPIFGAYMRLGGHIPVGTGAVAVKGEVVPAMTPPPGRDAPAESCAPVNPNRVLPLLAR